MHPAEQLAATIVDRYDLQPPVDVLALASEIADVEECAWPYRCDGLAVGLGNPRPKIFLRAGANGRRKRYTLAHEVGHIRMAWHVDNVLCHAEPEVDEESPEDGRGRELFLGIDQEWEANVFASHLLVPDRFLRPLTATYHPVPHLLDSLAVADVSAAAGVIALARHLPPGYVFEVPGLTRPVKSTGTHALDYVRSDWRPRLSDRAEESGTARHQGQAVRWWQLVASTDQLVADTDQRSTDEILHSVLDRLRLFDETEPLARSITSKVGGLLSKKRDMSNAKDLHAVLRYRFESDAEFRDLLDDAEFELYLRRRAEEIARKRSR